MFYYSFTCSYMFSCFVKAILQCISFCCFLTSHWDVFSLNLCHIYHLWLSLFLLLANLCCCLIVYEDIVFVQEWWEADCDASFKWTSFLSSVFRCCCSRRLVQWAIVFDPFISNLSLLTPSNRFALAILQKCLPYSISFINAIADSINDSWFYMTDNSRNQSLFMELI